MKKIDLHTHSNKSDGTMTPQALAHHAKKSDISVIALTDHDTIDGVKEFISACQSVGIDAIAGVEISAKYDTEMHILGLFVDDKNDEFKEKLDILQKAREIRNQGVLDLFKEQGFDITEKDVTDRQSTLESIGRAHFAKALVEKGYAQDTSDAFDRFLRRGRPCYKERITFNPKESIELIIKAGGLAVLAHPMFITRDENKLRALLTELKGYGLSGVECYYSEYDEAFTNMCLSITDELDLIPTGGSDFHGSNKPDIKIGEVNGGFVPYSVAERLYKVHDSLKKIKPL